MKERGILFKPDMIKASMGGWKKQTRRIVKNQPVYYYGYYGYEYDGKKYADEKDLKIDILKKAKYKVGDLLYIKETHCKFEVTGSMLEPTKVICKYKIDGEDLPEKDVYGKKLKWKSPMFMPKILARTWLKITGVRVEQVMDITMHDAIAEGIESTRDGWYKDYLVEGQWTANPVCSFWTLWDSINKKPKPRKVDGEIGYYMSYPCIEDPKQPDSYRGKLVIIYPNPWVYVYEFAGVKHAL